MYILDLYVHLHVTHAKVHNWKFEAKLQGYFITIKSLRAKVKQIKSLRTRCENLRSLMVGSIDPNQPDRSIRCLSIEEGVTMEIDVDEARLRVEGREDVETRRCRGLIVRVDVRRGIVAGRRLDRH